MVVYLKAEREKRRKNAERQRRHSFYKRNDLVILTEAIPREMYNHLAFAFGEKDLATILLDAAYYKALLQLVSIVTANKKPDLIDDLFDALAVWSKHGGIAQQLIDGLNYAKANAVRLEIAQCKK
jgi:hypothetical protein